MTKQERKEKFEKGKPFIQLAITGLVELFTGAVCNNVMSHVEGGKLFRWGAKIGAGLVGLMIGDKVSEYVCDGIEEFADNLDEFKQAIDEAKEETV